MRAMGLYSIKWYIRNDLYKDLTMTFYNKLSKKGLLYIVIQHGNDIKSVSVKYKIDLPQWDANSRRINKLHPNHIMINNRLDTIRAELERVYLKLWATGEVVTPTLVKDAYLGVNYKEKDVMSFFNEITPLLKKKLAKGSFDILEDGLDKLIEFNGSKSLLFNRVDHKYLRNFEEWLWAKGLSNNTVFKHFKSVKRICSLASKEGLFNYSIIEKYESPQYRQTQRTYLTVTEVAKIEGLLLTDIPNKVRFTVLQFLLGCYTGLRIGDRVNLKISDIKEALTKTLEC